MQNREERSRLEVVLRREIVDQSGARWGVMEARVHDVPGAESSHCLIFDSANVCRRLWRYPAEWARLPAEVVLTLMDHPRSFTNHDD